MLKRQHLSSDRGPLLHSCRYCLWLVSAILAFLPIAGMAADQSCSGGTLYQIEIEDADEAALIEQELQLHPVLVRGHAFYYYANEKLNRQLVDIGFSPRRIQASEIVTQIVRVSRTRSESALREFGARVILRERDYWIVYVTESQLAALRRGGFRDEPLRPGEPYPRQVKLVVARPGDVREKIAPLIDIYSVEPSKDQLIVFGGAFDYAIDELRAKGFRVELLPDPPGVKR